MGYKESDLTAEYSKYIRKHPDAAALAFNCVYEFKVKKNGESLHLDRDFQPQQIPSLIKAASGVLYHKLSDMSIGMKPFDAIQMCKVTAFIAVCWYRERVQKKLYLIEVQKIRGLWERGEYKYTESDAARDALTVIDLM